MSEKDNIKLKTDTLSSRKSSASVGVHVKRKRKIIAKPVLENPVKTQDASVEKKEPVKSPSLKTTNTEKRVNSSVKVNEAPSQDIKSPKKQKIDKDEKIEKMENKELHLKSPKQKKDKNKRIKTILKILRPLINSKNQPNP